MTFTLLSSAISIFVLIYIAYQRQCSPLASIPGPIIGSLSKWWLIKHTRKGDFHREIVRLHDAYGPLVRTAPNEVSIIDPSAIKKIYGARPTFAMALLLTISQAPARNFAKLDGTMYYRAVASLTSLVSKISRFMPPSAVL
jgi:hypothetical protein